PRCQPAQITASVPPTRPPYQVRPPRLKRKASTGASGSRTIISAVNQSLEPSRPPTMAQNRIEDASASDPARSSARARTQPPTRKPSATMIPNVEISMPNGWNGSDGYTRAPRRGIYHPRPGPEHTRPSLAGPDASALSLRRGGARPASPAG